MTNQELEQHFNDVSEYLKYYPNTGLFYWIKNTGKKNANSLAGSYMSKGYKQIGFKGKMVLAHRLAWFFEYGVFPAFDIDHVNGNKDDNSIINLRECTNAQNSQNETKARINNLTGFLGVIRNGDRYLSRITLNGKGIRLGLFNTAQEAHEAYLKAKRELHEFCTI
jgi:hypothetical protein